MPRALGAQGGYGGYNGYAASLILAYTVLLVLHLIVLLLCG